MSSATTPHHAYPTPANSAARPSTSIRPGIASSRPIPQPIFLPNLGSRRYRRRLDPADLAKHALNKPTIRRMARRGGVRRIKVDIYEETRKVIRDRIKAILRPAISIVEHQGRKTLTSLDIVYALKLLGNPIYGCGTIVHGDAIRSNAEYMRRRRQVNARNIEETRERIEREAREERVDQCLRQMRRGTR